MGLLALGPAETGDVVLRDGVTASVRGRGRALATGVHRLRVLEAAAAEAGRWACSGVLARSIRLARERRPGQCQTHGHEWDYEELPHRTSHRWSLTGQARGVQTGLARRRG